LIKAIETAYKGYRFRSRLEARYGVWLDAIGLEWMYEHEGFDLGGLGYYLPDFYLPLFKCYAEVKPVTLTFEEFLKCWNVPGGCLLFDGLPTDAKGHYFTEWDRRKEKRPPGQAYRRYVSGDEYGRVMVEQSRYKGRLWYLFGETAEIYVYDRRAEIAARQARFEHGEGER